MQATETKVATDARQHVLLATAGLFLTLAALAFWWNSRGPSATIEVEAERPLLKSDESQFRDTQVGLTFTPPPRWSMQGRTMEAPNVQVKERLLVKFKRMLPGQYPAWLRVYVEGSTHAALADAVAKRKPGPGWSNPSAVQTLTIAGRPAAKITYTGKYNGLPSMRHIVGVQSDDRTFWFIASYNIRDEAAPGETAAAIESAMMAAQ